jgi:hypothetical protein
LESLENGILEGKWVAGTLISGVFKFADGDVFYLEKYEEGEELIQGRYVWKNGDEFTGQWRHGKRSGRVCKEFISFFQFIFYYRIFQSFRNQFQNGDNYPTIILCFVNLFLADNLRRMRFAFLQETPKNNLF